MLSYHYPHHRRHDGADDRKDKAHTEVLHLVLACSAVIIGVRPQIY